MKVKQEDGVNGEEKKNEREGETERKRGCEEGEEEKRKRNKEVSVQGMAYFLLNRSKS